MKYFFPDAQDLVDPSFDFQTEDRNAGRVRQRDDVYAHELFSTRPFDGLLVSKGIVDGFGESSSRYSLAQRHRLLRVGAPEFFRTAGAKFQPLPIMGDCGAFTYVREETPPYTVDEVIDFYSECQFDLGISIDHVIMAFEPAWDEPGAEGDVPPDLVQRRELTLQLAAEFLRKHRARKAKFEPMGVAQGWSPKSYALSVKALQKTGYENIALGGMVPLKTPEILASLKGVAEVRAPKTRLHLLGVTRLDQVQSFASYGVASFDSTSPLRQAFKDDKNNYYTLDGAYTAIRIPQVDANPKLQKRILAGQVKQEEARRLERACLDAMGGYDAGRVRVEQVLAVLREYEGLYDPTGDHSEAYAKTLEDKPWRDCQCEICRALGHHVILFRGAERNRRRGLHNVWMLYRRLKRELLPQLDVLPGATRQTRRVKSNKRPAPHPRRQEAKS